MTAAVPGPRFRDQLAEALPESLGPVGLRRRAIPALGVEASVTGYGLVLLDALMPTIAAEVEARVQAAANQARVEELEAAAAAIHEQRWRHRNGLGSAREAEQLVRDRAAALTQPASAACRWHERRCSEPNALCLVDCARAAALASPAPVPRAEEGQR